MTKQLPPILRNEEESFMYEYLPWSKRELSKSLQDYCNGILSILDIELGGECNFHCKYCDSPDRHKDFHVNIEKIEAVMQEREIRWVYICGLGEPTYKQNGIILEKLLDIAEKNNVRCSIFTNLSNITDKLLEYVDKGILYLLFKMDSLSETNISDLYGIETANLQIEKVKKLVDHVIIRNGCTNLAASIVPTKTNMCEVPQIVEWCIEKNIFPLLAELENAGAGINSFNRLCLSKEELSDIKWEIMVKYSEDIDVPICPAMISGIHINNEGIVTVDKKTGFSCHWFWLKTPEVMHIADFNENGTWNEYSSLIRTYRMKQTENVKLYLENSYNDFYVFGGCGGSIKELLLSHIVLHKSKMSL